MKMAENIEMEHETTPNYECRDFNDIARCFTQMHKSIFEKITSIENRTKILEDKAIFLEGKVESADFTLQQQNDIIKDITEIRLVNLDDKLQEEERSRLALEVWGRKWNLVIRGIEGSTNESPMVTEEKVRAFFSRDLNLNERSMIFAAVHRLPVRNSNTTGQTRASRGTIVPNILVRFINIQDRDGVIQAAVKKLNQGSGISVVPDLPPTINKIRQTLLLQRKSMSKEEKKKVKLVYLKFYPFVALKPKRVNDPPNTSVL